MVAGYGDRETDWEKPEDYTTSSTGGITTEQLN